MYARFSVTINTTHFKQFISKLVACHLQKINSMTPTQKKTRTTKPNCFSYFGKYQYPAKHKTNFSDMLQGSIQYSVTCDQWSNTQGYNINISFASISVSSHHHQQETSAILPASKHGQMNTVSYKIQLNIN